MNDILAQFTLYAGAVFGVAFLIALTWLVFSIIKDILEENKKPKVAPPWYPVNKRDEEYEKDHPQMVYDYKKEAPNDFT